MKAYYFVFSDPEPFDRLTVRRHKDGRWQFWCPTTEGSVKGNGRWFDYRLERLDFSLKPSVARQLAFILGND